MELKARKESEPREEADLHVPAFSSRQIAEVLPYRDEKRPIEVAVAARLILYLPPRSLVRMPTADFMMARAT